MKKAMCLYKILSKGMRSASAQCERGLFEWVFLQWPLRVVCVRLTLVRVRLWEAVW
jgi:hypothetical protein